MPINRNEMNMIASEVRTFVERRIADVPSAQPGRDGPIGPQGIPGPPGANGRDGRDGRDGKDSDVTRAEVTALVADEVGLQVREAMNALKLEGRKLMIGEQIISVLSLPEYRGVFRAEVEYVRGDMVTFGGSVWHCNEKTLEKPGDGSPGWTLIVKRGRDGKDAR